MKLPVLIPRTVSVEKLSATLEACAARWPGHPLLVATDPARGREVAQDTRIAAILPYASGSRGFVGPIEEPRPLEAVVVPVANRHGRGYANVLRACRGLKARHWFLASHARELHELGAFAWAWRWRFELGLEAPARLFGRLWARFMPH